MLVKVVSMQPSQRSSHPESDWYKARLQRQRRFRFFAAIALLCLSGYFLISDLIQFPFRDTGSIASFLALTLVLVWLGTSEFFANRGPVPIEEIERLRQQERFALFRQAQGKLPWQYHPWVRVLELLLALFCLFMAVGHTIAVARSNAQWLVGGYYLLVALLLLFDALYLKPRQSKQLAAKSAIELSSRLRAGEFVEESQPEPEQKA